METNCLMSTFEFASVSLEKKESSTHAAHTLSLECRRAHAASVGVILLLARVLRDFPRAWVSHLVHCGLFFLKKSVSLEQTYPLVTLQGSECSDQHIHLRNVLSLHLLMTYIFVILTGAERDILELLSQTDLDLGRTRYFCSTTTQQKGV